MNIKMNKIFSVVTILAMMLMALPVPFSVNAQTEVLISEVRIDQTGTDNDEYFELAGEPGTSLDGLTYLVIGDGTTGSGVIEGVVPLSGSSIPTSGYFVAAESTFTLGIADLNTGAALNFENSDNVTHLLVRDFSGVNGSDLDTNDDGTLDVTPWTEIVDLIALILQENPPTTTEYHYGPPTVGPDGTFVPGHVFFCADGWKIGVFDPASGNDTPGAANDCEIPLPDVFINEVRIDQTGTDNDEYFELAGEPGTSLDGLTYLVIGDGASTAGSGVVEAVVSLNGNVIPDSGYFVAAESTFTLGTADLNTGTALNFENSDNVTHLLVRDFSGVNGADLDANNDGTLDVTPWTAIVDLVALILEENPPTTTEYHYGPPSVGPDGTFVPGHVFLCEDGWKIGPFDPSSGNDTPGAANDCEIPLPDVFINEVRIDQTGTDNDEYFELAGEPGTTLDGLTYLVVGDGTAGSGVIEAVVNLSGNAIPASGYLVAAESTFTLGSADLNAGTALNFENEDNVTHLLVRDFSGANGIDLDTNNDGVLDVTPWTEIVDLIALVKEQNPPSTTEFHYGPPTVGPDGTFVPGHVFLCSDGWKIGGFTAGTNDTPGAANDCAPPPPPLSCEGTFTLTAIHDIQGSGASTSMSGQEVIIEGVVVGDFQASDGDATDLAGFYVQEEDSQADANPLTSEGLFVFDLGSSVNVQAGDVVRVLGNVNEFQNQTQINAAAVVVCGSGQGALVSPTAIPFPLPTGQADLEQYEGMLVTTNQPMTVIEYFNLDRFGTVDVATERLETPTDAAEPGSASDAVLAYNNARRIRLDDGSQTQNPFPVTLPDGQLEYGDAFGGGDTLSNIVGVLSWIRPWTGAQPEGYAIQLTHLPTFENTNPRPADPPQVGGSFKVVGFNVLNYFNGNGMGGGFPTSRGATDPAEFQKQTTKIVAALAALNADVVGLIEIENDFADGANSAIADLVDALNAATAPGTYVYINPGVNVGTDEIAVAIIYKPATATPVGDLAILDSQDFVNPFNADVDRNRPALAQTFMSVETGGVMTVVVNHLKSKGSGCGPNDDDPRQGSCNLTRTASAQVLVDWLATDPTSSGDADFLLIGDYNSYAKEDPIDVFTDAGYVDLFALFQPEDVYSYVFDGMTGYLDYGIASPTLVGQVTGAAPWNINSDEPDAFEYDEEFDHPSNLPLWYAPTAYRSSDHDPVVVGLDLLQYGFDGFFPPIDNVPTVNTVKAGQAVPIKFSLSGDLGLDVFFDGYPTFEFGSCDPSSGDPVEETVPDSNSGLTYDPVTNEYTFVWKTERSWANKCGTLTIVFDDGTVRNILFRFTR